MKRRISEGDKVTVRMNGEDIPGEVRVIDRNVSPIEYAVRLDGQDYLLWKTRGDLKKA